MKPRREAARIATEPKSSQQRARQRLGLLFATRLPGPTLAGARKLLHRAVSEGGAVGRRAYPVLSDLEQKLSSARRS